MSENKSCQRWYFRTNTSQYLILLNSTSRFREEDISIQDGGCGGQLGFPIGTILAIFYLVDILMLQYKIEIKKKIDLETKNTLKIENGRLNPNASMIWENKSKFRGWLWRSSLIFYPFRFSYFVSSRCPDAPHQVSTQFDHCLKI